MYYIDNPAEVMDNLTESRSTTGVTQLVQQRKTESELAKFAPVETVGIVADSKTHGGTVSVSSQGNCEVVQQCKGIWIHRT